MLKLAVVQLVRASPRPSQLNVAVVVAAYEISSSDAAPVLPPKVKGNPPSECTLKACRPSLRAASSDGADRRKGVA